MAQTTLEQIIADIEQLNKVAEEAPQAEAPAAAPAVENEVEELRKIASEVDSQGRLLARSFYDELQKIAVEATGMTPNTATEGANPAVQVSNGEAHEADTAQVDAILKKLSLGGVTKFNPAGAVHVNNQPVGPTQPIAQDEHPLAADVKKTAGEYVIESLYNKYFA